jgi:hypothetical protein
MVSKISHTYTFLNYNKNFLIPIRGIVKFLSPGTDGRGKIENIFFSHVHLSFTVTSSLYPTVSKIIFLKKSLSSKVQDG